MKNIKVLVNDIEVNVVEITEDEAIGEFGYDFSGIDGAVAELAVENSEGSLVAYRLESGEYAMYVSGRGVYCTVANRDEAIKMLVDDEMSR